MRSRNMIQTGGRALAILMLLGLLPKIGSAQNSLNPYKITLYRDAAQITQKGILRFFKKQARVPFDLNPIEETISFTATGEFRITWYKFTYDTLETEVNASNWAEILEANQGRTLSILFEIGTEYDELTGTVTMINAEQGMILLRNRAGADYFIPMGQIRQVIVDSMGAYKLKRKTTRRMVEIGINNDVPFVPIELNCLHEGLSWEPQCRIRILDQQQAVIRMSAVIKNSIQDFDDILLELSTDFLNLKGQARSEMINAGKINLKKNEDIVFNVKDTPLEFQSEFNSAIPWEGTPKNAEPRSYPVENTLRFKIPVTSQNLACGLLAVNDQENRHIANLDLSDLGEKGRVKLELGTEEGVDVSLTEVEKKRFAKPVKLDNKLFIKVAYDAKVMVRSELKDPVKIRVKRTLSGDLIEAGTGKTANGQNNTKTITWTVSVNPGEPKELDYRYYAYLPYQENKK